MGSFTVFVAQQWGVDRKGLDGSGKIVLEGEG